MSRWALLRAAAAPLLATVIGVAVPLSVAPPAHAAHAAPAVQSAPAPTAPGDDDSDPDRPVRIDVGRFEPRTVSPDATVRVTGTLSNTGSATVSDLRVRLQRGELMTTRAELAADARDPDPMMTVVPEFAEVPGELDPGDELAFEYSIPAADLQIGGDGVYPVLLNVNGTIGGEERRVGELSTEVIAQSVLPGSRTTVGWLWPITERSHRDAFGDFLDDGLADLVSEGGRLDRALSVVERLPGATGADGGVAPAVEVTLAIDPALVEELTVMAAGPYAVDGEEGAGRGTAAAVRFLERLRAVAAAQPVMALPYADVDLDALASSSLTAVLVRSLPVTPSPTADEAEGADQAEAGGEGIVPAPDAAPEPGTAPDGAAPEDTAPADAAPDDAAPADGDGGEPAPGSADAPAPASLGARILVDALGVQPRTDLSWPAAGTARPDTVATLVAAGMDRVVLSSGALTDAAEATGLTRGNTAAGARATLPGGPVEVLVADATLSALAGSAEETPGGPRLAEQRYLAELALITLQAPPGSSPSVLVAPPRNVSASPEGAAAMMADSAGLPWLRPGTVAELLAAPPVDVGQVVAPQDAVLLDPVGLADVVAAVALRNDLASAVVGDAGTALQPFDAAIARATSVAWRDEPAAFRDVATGLRATIDALRERVSLISPADGTYTLGSSDAPLVLTVENNLPFPVEVRLAIEVRASRGLSVDDVGLQRLAPGQRSTLQVPTQVQQSGGFAVTAALTTPDGGTLGRPIDLQVNSTAYGPISVLITVGAAALLGLLFLRRLVRYLLRRRRAAAGSASPDSSGDATTPRPPTRSPV